MPAFAGLHSALTAGAQAFLTDSPETIVMRIRVRSGGGVAGLACTPPISLQRFALPLQKKRHDDDDDDDALRCASVIIVTVREL